LQFSPKIFRAPAQKPWFGFKRVTGVQKLNGHPLSAHEVWWGSVGARRQETKTKV